MCRFITCISHLRFSASEWQIFDPIYSEASSDFSNQNARKTKNTSPIMPEYLNILFTVAFTFLKGLVKTKVPSGTGEFQLFQSGKERISEVQKILWNLSHLLDTKGKISYRHTKNPLLLAINSFIGQNLHIFDGAYRQQLKGPHPLSQTQSWL